MQGRNPTTVFALSEIVGRGKESNKRFFINKCITNKLPILHVSTIAKTHNSGSLFMEK